MSDFPALATSIPGVQDALFEALRDDVDRPVKAGGFPGQVACDLGFPLRMDPEHVWVEGGVDEIEREYGISGMSSFDESYTLHVKTLVKMIAADYVTVRDRAVVIAAWAEGVVTSDPTLGGVVDQAAVSVADWSEGVPSETEREVGITLAVRIFATVSG